MIEIFGWTLVSPGLSSWLVGAGVSAGVLLVLLASRLRQVVAAKPGGTLLSRLGQAGDAVLCSIPRFGEHWYRRWERRLGWAGMPLRPAELMALSLAWGLLIGLLFEWLLGYALLALFVGLLATRVPYLYVAWRANRQQAKFTRQTERLCITLALEAENGLDSGRLLNRAARARAPLGPLFQHVLDERHQGVDVAVALEHLSARVSHPHLERLLRPLLAHVREGAQLAPLLRAAADEIRMEDELAVQLVTQLAQPRHQFWIVCLLSIPMLVVLHWGDPHAVDTFLGTPLVLWYLLLWGWAFFLYGIVRWRTTLKSLYRSVS